MVAILPEATVEVSFDRLPITEITGYRVHYSRIENSRKRQDGPGKLFVEVPLTDDPRLSVRIIGLSRGLQYQFQVVAFAEVDGIPVEGVRTTVSDSTIVRIAGNLNFC